jgi:transcriptional regulator with XRE-family HTH domain
MSKVSVMRILRHRYKITTRELAEAVGVSQQYMSDLELGKYLGIYDYRKSGEPMVLLAFEAVAAGRQGQAGQLPGLLAKYRHSLLDFVEENDEL